MLIHRGVTFKIPAGFVHDGASVPRFAWSLTGIRPDGLLRAGALLHDIIYRYKGALPDGWTQPRATFDRDRADLFFYQINVRAGMRPWRAYIAYRMVRWFGSWAWLR